MNRTPLIHVLIRMKIVFTDLDGTLLDHDTYSFSAAKEELTWLKNHNVPVIFCTSKTRAEIIYWKQQTDNFHPFISENGGGIFIPIDYFDSSIEYSEKTNQFYLIRFGSSFTKLKKTMNYIESSFEVTSFLHMSVSQLMDTANLSKKHAELALKREFDIPFIIHNENQIDDIKKVIKENNLSVTKGGRFYHLVGDNDKGKAVRKLTELYKNEYDSIESIGIGDSTNDFPMLHEVDHPYLVMKKNHTVASDAFPHSTGIGPYGWQEIIEKEFNIV